MFRSFSALLAVLLNLAVGTAMADEPRAVDESRTVGSIERLDPRLDKLVPRDAQLEVLAEGFDWSEGPVWVPDGPHVLFSDVPQNKVYKWKQGEGLSVFLHPSGYTGESSKYSQEPGSNGLALDLKGQLLLCQHGDRRVARLEDDGSFTTLAAEYEGKRLNSPNDLAVASDGSIYFTDPPYGLPKNAGDPARELDFCGVYRRAPDGTLTLLTKEMTRPNGIALSPDEKTLYVAQSDPKAALWRAFDVQPDGTLSGGRVFADMTHKVGQEKGLPDGMKVDQHGNLFATGPGGVLIFAPDGTHLGTLKTGVPTGNCTFGDDGSTLYITADMHLLRVRLNTRGDGF